MREHPDRKQCLEYLESYGTPKHVIGHCKSVAAVAYMFGKALNKVGGTRAAQFKDIRLTTFRRGAGRFYYEQDHSRDKHGQGWRIFDLDLLLASGLLHDMARVEDRHWDVCADWCHEKKYYEEEQIIRAHMMYQYTNDANHLTEADLISLADRLTLEDHYAGLDERMEYIIRKAEKNGNPDARAAILRKKKETRKLLDDIEVRIGITIDELMTDIDYDNVENSDK
ncbi:MAG: hypothetical protein MJ161_03230 [Clostridia bacterium]|nr:hypothetical protein [Clostridia bacterium]